MEQPGSWSRHDTKELPSGTNLVPPPLSPRREASQRRWIDPQPPTTPADDRPSTRDFFVDPHSLQYSGNQHPEDWKSPNDVHVEIMAVEDAPVEAKLDKPSTFLVLSLYLSVFLSALDITIITTALPMISEHLGTNATGFVWIGSTYLLAGASSEPIWAKLSDIFGRKPILMAANAAFLAGSTVCALSKTVQVLIIGRVIQGLGSGGLLVLANILIGDLFSPRERGKYYGQLGLVWSVANALGPFLGGVFATKMSWQWCFWVNVPLDGLALILTAIFLNVKTPYTPFWEGICAVDWLGSLSVVGGTVCLLLGLQFGGVTFDWDSAPVITLIVSGLAIWVIFFLIETHVPKYPLMPIRIFKTISNLSILIIDFSHGFVFIAGSYYLPVYFQAVLGANALQSGVYLFPYVLSLSATSIATGYVINKTGIYLPLITGGMTFLTLGFALFMDLPAEVSWHRIVIYQIIAGIGVGPNFQSPMLALQNSVAPHDIGPATATFGFVRQLANAVSVVLGGVLLQGEMFSHRIQMLEGGVDERVVELLTGGAAISSVMEIDHLPEIPRAIARKAFAHSMSKMWLMYACVGIIGLGLTDFIRRQELSTDHSETKTGLEEQERIRREEEEKRMKRKAGRSRDGPSSQDGRYEDKPKRFDSGSKSAGLLSLSRSNSLKREARSRSASRSTRSSKGRRDLEIERARFFDANGSKELGPAPTMKKEGALHAARKRTSLRNMSKKIAEDRHPVRPLRQPSPAPMRENSFLSRKRSSSFYPPDGEAGWYDEISEITPADVEKVNAKFDQQLRISQSWASRYDAKNNGSSWMTRESDSPPLGGKV